MPGKFAEPLIGEETPNGSNFDDEGEQIDGSDFRSIYAICTELGISNDIVERIIYGKPKKEIKKAGEELPEVNPNVRHKVGRSRTRSETELFSLADIRRIYEEGIQGEDGELLPETNEENILLVDGKPYCTVKQIHRNTGLPESRINNIVSGHSLVPIRARAGNTKQPSDLYPIQEILDIARESVLGFPIFPERQENYEIDGENWANIKSLASSLAVSESTLTGLLKTKTEDGWIINDGIKNN